MALLDDATQTDIDARWKYVDDARAGKRNLWHESWDQPLAALDACYHAAKLSQTPQAWRSVVIQGRAVRSALDHHDGYEHKIYIEVTRFTDIIDVALDKVAGDTRNLVPAAELHEVTGRLDQLRDEMRRERDARGFFETSVKKTLDDGLEKVAKARKALISVGEVKPNVTIFSTGLGEAADLIKKAVEFVNQSNVVIDKIKQVARRVRAATGEFIRQTKARFDALKIAWRRLGSEGFFGVGGSREPQPGDSLQDCWEQDGKRLCGPELVVVPAGEFTMGSNDYDSEKPPHKVANPAPLAVGRFAVTFDEWDAAVAAGGVTHKPDDQGWGRGRRPVINVSWEDAMAYCAWLSKTTGKPYRLLSEAEWEYCCRAGTTTMYSFGDTITRTQAQFSEREFGSAKQTVEVGTFPSNAWGLHDMHGNVWEWCADKWHGNYKGAPADGTVWQGGDTSSRVLRGGSWLNYPGILRSALRDRYLPVDRYNCVGFRVARVVSPARTL